MTFKRGQDSEVNIPRSSKNGPSRENQASHGEIDFKEGTADVLLKSAEIGQGRRPARRDRELRDLLRLLLSTRRSAVQIYLDR